MANERKGGKSYRRYDPDKLRAHADRRMPLSKPESTVAGSVSGMVVRTPLTLDQQEFVNFAGRLSETRSEWEGQIERDLEKIRKYREEYPTPKGSSMPSNDDTIAYLVAGRTQMEGPAHQVCNAATEVLSQALQMMTQLGVVTQDAESHCSAAGVTGPLVALSAVSQSRSDVEAAIQNAAQAIENTRGVIARSIQAFTEAIQRAQAAGQ